MKIADREIGLDHPTLIVAELSGSHLGSLKNAHRLIDYAADAGVDSIKLQTYEPEDFTTPDTPPFADGPWKGMRPWELYSNSHTPRSWHAELFDHAHERGVVAFSSPFSPGAVEFLETLDCPVYKVASLETDYLPLLRAITATEKPVFISTGAASSDDCNWVGRSGALSCMSEYPIVLMHCVSAYPTPVGRANLMRFWDLGTNVSASTLGGLSDHSQGFMVAVLATALGACVIEKHIKLYEDHDGPDAAFAETPAGFAAMVENVRLAEEALKGRDNSDLEAPMRALRRHKVGDRWVRT